MNPAERPPPVAGINSRDLDPTRKRRAVGRRRTGRIAGSTDRGEIEVTAASDATLVIAIGRESGSALAEVYRRHGGAVYGLACRVVGAGGQADDVTQEVFVGLWSRPERYDAARGSLRAYLLAAAHSRAVDLLRAESSRGAREARHLREQSRLASKSSLEDQVGDSMLGHEIRRGVERLPADERLAIELAYFGGRSYREVAAVLAEPEGTVKSRIRRGLRRLSNTLEPEAGLSGTPR